MTDYVSLAKEYVDRKPSANGARAQDVIKETLGGLTNRSDSSTLHAALHTFGVAASEMDPLERAIARSAAVKLLGKGLRHRAPAQLVDAALSATAPSPSESPSRKGPSTVEPWPEPVDGAELLNDLTTWIARYVYLPEGASDSIAAWAVLTWFWRDVYFAPLLAIVSATKRCGKTVLLDVLKHLVHRGCPTSGVGITTAVTFRLNERDHPTFLIDEAERLAGRHADRDLIGMLNVGYRRGARVQRCVEQNGTVEVAEFDAFGFRALAAIGTLWDTIMDRAITIHLERRPRDIDMVRFSDRTLSAGSVELVRRIARWAEDNRDSVGEREANSPRPSSLGDRECDNWSGLFAVGSLAGRDWPSRLLGASRLLRLHRDHESDDGERLVKDMHEIFETGGWPEVCRSSELVAKLSEIETAPWGDYRAGSGISPHRLARMLRPFGVSPRQERTSLGEKVRGYWLKDLATVFQRYVGQTGTAGTTEPDGGGGPSETG